MTLPRDLLVRTSALRSEGLNDRQIARSVAAGRLIRIRRGVYVDGPAWAGLNGRQKHLLRVAAAADDSADAVATGRSAAAVWGVPLLGAWPKDVTFLSEYRGGGRSEPGVRRTAVGARRAPSELRHGIEVTTLARTVVDIAALEGLESGVVAADWALANGVERDDLVAAAHARTSSYARAAIATVVDFADGAAENPGESATRVAISVAGFMVPELQVTFVDDRGEMRTDFFWREARITGEFDGKMKYTRDEFTHGDPAGTVWKEKLREDRLRRINPGHLRIVWSEVRNRAALTGVLSAAGVPRR